MYNSLRAIKSFRIDLKAERSSQSLTVARLKTAKIELSIIKKLWRKLCSL
jgi:hypothetical protein